MSRLADGFTVTDLRSPATVMLTGMIVFGSEAAVNKTLPEFTDAGATVSLKAMEMDGFTGSPVALLEIDAPEIDGGVPSVENVN